MQVARKPIFEEHYPSFGDFDREALRLALENVGHAGVRMAEVGSWLGTGSTQVLIEHARRYDGTLVCVDTWQGSPGVERHEKIVANFDVYGTFIGNVRRAGGSDCVEPLRCSSLEAALRFPDETYDFIFLDADHSYDATRQDIAAWMPKLKPGGLLCGHDCETRLTVDNRERLIAGRNTDHIRGEFPFPVWHAGVILAVDELFGWGARLWSEIDVTLADGRKGRATIWDVTIA
jgi:predicted O-methyltransferase YrrM